jgi:muramoyltetrapeptide carboxypeptidase
MLFPMTIRKPPRLRPGDVIGLVSPASPPLPTDKIEKGTRYLEGLGYRVKLGQHVAAQHGYFAGSDAERVSDLNAMLHDPQVNAIFAVRGGYGSPRLLPFVDYRAARRRPKILVGFSDITALQLALFRRAGLVTFSGALPGVEFWQKPDPYTEEHFWRLLTSPRRIGQLPGPGKQPLHSRIPGRAQGPLLGGNLSLVMSNLGTPFSPDYRRAILVLEDVGEDFHRIDRMFTQLRNAGILERISGLVLGQFTHCQPSDSSKPHLTLSEILIEMLGWTNIPAVEGLQYGHLARKLTLPIGLCARLDADRGTLTVPESAVE